MSTSDVVDGDRHTELCDLQSGPVELNLDVNQGSTAMEGLEERQEEMDYEEEEEEEEEEVES